MTYHKPLRWKFQLLLGLTPASRAPRLLHAQPLDGLASKITAISVPDDGHAVVTFTTSDDRGKLLDLLTLISQADGSVKAVQPIASACVGCHSKEAAKAHMDTMTNANSQEACVTCRGVSRAFAVEKVHRR